MALYIVIKANPYGYKGGTIFELLEDGFQRVTLEKDPISGKEFPIGHEEEGSP